VSDVQSEPRVNTRPDGAAREGGYAPAPMLRRALALLLAVLPGCVDGEAVDYAFCGDGEACQAIEEPPVVCGGVECPSSRCYVNVHCNPEKPSECIGDGYSKDFDDGNLCTVETCGNEGWIHTKIPASELDDGNSCTVDQCDPSLGITHQNHCG